MSVKTNAFELLAQVWPTLSLQAARVFIVPGLASTIVRAAGSKGKVDAVRIKERRVMKFERLDKIAIPFHIQTG
jgi:hypothetical protein